MDNSESMLSCAKNIYALREILKFFDHYMEKYFYLFRFSLVMTDLDSFDLTIILM